MPGNCGGEARSFRNSQECSPEPIYKIFAPQGIVCWLVFYFTDSKLAGKTASKQLLAYWFNIRSSS